MIMQGTGLVIAHTSSPEPCEWPVDLGSDAPTLQGNSHAPTHICHTQFRSPSAALGREGGLGDSPMCISLWVHTTLANRPSGAFASVAMDPSLMATHIPPRPFSALTGWVLVHCLGVTAGSATRPCAYRSGSTQPLANRLSGAFASVAMDPSCMATHIPPPTFYVLTSGVPVHCLGVRAASATHPRPYRSRSTQALAKKVSAWVRH